MDDYISSMIGDVYNCENFEKYDSKKLKKLKKLESDIFKEYTSNLNRKFTQWW